MGSYQEHGITECYNLINVEILINSHTLQFLSISCRCHWNWDRQRTMKKQVKWLICHCLRSQLCSFLGSQFWLLFLCNRFYIFFFFFKNGILNLILTKRKMEIQSLNNSSWFMINLILYEFHIQSFYWFIKKFWNYPK